MDRRDGFSVLKDDDVAPLIPPTYHQPPPQHTAMTNMSSNTTNVVELQPMGSQEPRTIQVVQPPGANDHLWFTIALMVLCFLMCCNFTGALCLMPGLICASLAADYNKEGRVEKARSLGSMAFIYDIIILVIHAFLYVMGILSSIITVAIVVNRASQAVDDTVHVIDTVNTISDHYDY